MKISVENWYSDGYEATVEYEIDDATVPTETHCVDTGSEHAWEVTETSSGSWSICAACGVESGEVMREFFFTYTGDGHGIDRDVDSISEITILDGDLAGTKIEIGG